MLLKTHLVLSTKNTFIFLSQSFDIVEIYIGMGRCIDTFPILDDQHLRGFMPNIIDLSDFGGKVGVP